MARFNRYFSPKTQTLITYLFPVFFALIALNPISLNEYLRVKTSMVKGNQLPERLVNWISQQQGRQSSVMMADCGATGYFSDLVIIDSYCLNSKEMTSDAIHNSVEKFAHRVLTIDKPKTIVLTSLQVHKTKQMAPVDTVIANATAFKQNYRLVKLFQTSMHHEIYQYAVYFSKPKGQS